MKKASIGVVAALPYTVVATDLEMISFLRHLAEHNYAINNIRATDEMKVRQDNYNKIDAYIKKTNASQSLYKLGHNFFSTLSTEEKL